MILIIVSTKHPLSSVTVIVYEFGAKSPNTGLIWGDVNDPFEYEYGCWPPDATTSICASSTP